LKTIAEADEFFGNASLKVAEKMALSFVIPRCPRRRSALRFDRKSNAPA